MKLSEYVQKLQELARDYPDALVIHASDDEGNSFHPVSYVPTTGKFEDGDFDDSAEDVNAVCIN